MRHPPILPRASFATRAGITRSVHAQRSHAGLSSAIRFILGTFVLGVSIIPQADGEVIAAAPGGFNTKISLVVSSATPLLAYKHFLEVARWWNGEHTYSGSSSNLTLTAEPGGCFCETLADGGFIRHAQVEYAEPGKSIRLSGALGPLQPMGVVGSLTLDLAPAGKDTQATLFYNVSGFTPDKGLGELAPLVDKVLQEQLERFKRYAETGKPG
jgi:hypothetical protein